MRQPCIVTTISITSTGNAELVERDEDGTVVARAVIINEDGTDSVNRVCADMLRDGIRNGIYALNAGGLSRVTQTTGEIRVAA